MQRSSTRSHLPMSAAPPSEDVQRRIDALVALASPGATCDPATSEQAARDLRDLAIAAGDEERAIETGVWLAVHLLRRSRLRESLDEALQVRERLGSPPPGSRLAAARLELLRTLALAASEAGEFGVALDAAQELAGDRAVRADAVAAFDAAFALAVCFERMGNSWQALRILDGVLTEHADAAPSFQMLYTLNGVAATALGAFHRLHGLDVDDETAAHLVTARTAAERARELLEQFDNPLYRVAVEGNLGEALTYQGELDAASTLLEGARARAVEIGAPAHAARVRASIGAWLVRSGRHDEALRSLDQLIADVGDDGPHSTRVRAHHAAYLAARALGQHDRAIAHHETYERLERLRTTNQLRGQSVMFVSRIEADAEVEHHRATAERDPLTGLGNRRRLTTLLRELVPAAAAAQDAFAIAVLDLDKFKSVNDDFGHATGDAVLVELARVLDHAVDRDTIVRFGGEEIVIVFPRASAQEAFERCEQLRAELADRAWDSLPPDRRLTVSIGVAAAPPYDGDHLLRAADRSLYCAKRAGRNLVHLGASPEPL